MSDERETDVYFKKVIRFDFARQHLQFRVSQDLFSSHDIDVGTKFLLRTIAASHVGSPEAILDLGCGYGPIGLTLKRLYDRALVHLTDRDALAVEYASQNAAINRLTEGVEAYGSLGYDDLRRSTFDLIASNIPGKAGESVILELLLGAADVLAPGGLAAVVVVAPLEALVESVLGSRSDIGVVLRERRPGHTVFHYRFASGAEPPQWGRRDAFERGVYHRQDAKVALRSGAYPLQTVFGLPEFETPSYATELLIEALADMKTRDSDRVLCFNPGQGHVPVALCQLCQPQAIALVDRDLLALKTSRLNLLRTGCPPGQIDLVHQVGLPPPPRGQMDLVVGVLREEEGRAAIATTMSLAAQHVSPQGRVIVAGSSTAITRLVSLLRGERWLEVVDRKRQLGWSLLVLSPSRGR